MVSVHLLCFLFVLSLLTFCEGFEPMGSTVGVVGGIVLSAAYAGWEFSKGSLRETCNDQWIKFNYSGLQSSLRHSLHGQHLVELTVARAVQGHVNNPNPKKALALAFHGWTGSGKNFASYLIANHLYYEGIKSQFVHLYIATQHFKHASEVKSYQDKLEKEIKHYTKLCGRSLFIFDELDKMPAGVIDALKPYLDYYEDVDGVNYRRNIFIFLSNAGGSEITRVAFNAWLSDRERESIKLKDVEPAINKGAFNERGGLQHSDIVKKELIDLYIPFLPLEKKHVKLCIRDEMRSRSQYLDDDVIRDVANQLEYYPPEFEVYSTSGCKKIASKIDLYVD